MLDARCGYQGLLTLIGFALAGEASKGLVEGMGLSSSPDMLLRLVRTTPDQPVSTPRVLGGDDFSFYRRKTFGTILIDLEKRVPVDLLPDREAETFAKWLITHPGVKIISRDRGGDYAKGTKQGAPNAKQTADRWHLLKNLSEDDAELLPAEATTAESSACRSDLLGTGRH